MLFLSLQASLLAFFAVAISASPDPRNWGSTWSVNYQEGEKWNGNGANGADVAVANIRNACFGFDGQRGFYENMYFKSWSSSPYTAKLCVNTWGTHVDFEIGNLNPSAGFTLKPQDCFDSLNAIVRSSLRGGEWQREGWYLRADPNVGNC